MNPDSEVNCCCITQYSPKSSLFCSSDHAALHYWLACTHSAWCNIHPLYSLRLVLFDCWTNSLMDLGLKSTKLVKTNFHISFFPQPPFFSLLEFFFLSNLHPHCHLSVNLDSVQVPLSSTLLVCWLGVHWSMIAACSGP